MAFYFRAAISSRSLHGLLLVGPERNFADRFLLGRLAWPDANVRLLPHLRCENWNLRRSDPPARFRHVRDLVRHCRGAFAISSQRYPRHLLSVRRAVYPAVGRAVRSRSISFGGHRGVGLVSRSFPPDVDHRPPSKPREGGVTGYQHRILVVLQ